MTPLRINGATRLYAIIGDPIAQVKSPELFSGRFADAGVNAVMFPVHVLPDRFDTTVPVLMRLGNLDGLIFTVPYKGQATQFADRLGATAARIGALNALRRERDGTWSGDMFDGAGFVRGAEHKGEVLRGRNVVLFGAGGAGSAIACELADAGIESLSIIDLRRERASALANTLRDVFPACRIEAVATVPRSFDMVVNASTVGMRDDDGLPGELDALTADTLVGDVIVLPKPTPLIRHAVRHGCRYVDGHDMIAGQADALMAFFGHG